jgi:hypothetical protein
MSKTVHSVKLQPYDSVDLERLSYSNGDLVYDITNNTIRLMDGVTQGGKKIATQSYVVSSLAAYATTASLSSYATTASLSSYATTASLSSYATTASLSSYITSTSLTTTLNSYATTSSVSALAPTLNPVFTGSITTPQAIIGGVNIKSFAIAMGAGLA